MRRLIALYTALYCSRKWKSNRTTDVFKLRIFPRHWQQADHNVDGQMSFRLLLIHRIVLAHRCLIARSSSLFLTHAHILRKTCESVTMRILNSNVMFAGGLFHFQVSSTLITSLHALPAVSLTTLPSIPYAF
jgi:hypothetical protein